MTNAQGLGARLEQSILLAILPLPLLFAALGMWELWRGWATLAEARAMAGMPPGATADTAVAALRLGMAGLVLLAGLASAGAGMAGLAMVARSARQGMRSRPALVASFQHVSHVLPLLLAMQVVGLAAAMGGAATFEGSGLWFEPDADDKAGMLALMGLVYAGLALWGCFQTLRGLRRALRLFMPEPLLLDAAPVTEAQAPSLFVLLRELARERGAAVPDTVVVGMKRGFFVAAFPTRLRGAPGRADITTRGRILHLSLPGVAALDRTELRTVLAHELAHFSGEDTEYSLQFKPLYAGLGQGANAMSVRRTNWGSTLPDRLLEHAVHPHTALAIRAFQRFDHVVAHWSRQRELEADRAAVAAGSAAALASSLLRVGLVDGLLNQTMRSIAEHPETTPPDLATTLANRLGTAAAGDPAAHLGDHAPHPTDTHPPIWQRIKAAGVPIDGALLAHAARPVSEAEALAAQGLFADWSGVSHGLSDNLQAWAAERLQAHRSRLRDVAGQAGAGVTLLHASLLRPAVSLALFGSFCLAVSAGCILAAVGSVQQDREAWRLLGSIAAVSAVGFGFTILWTVRVLRGRRAPYLVLTPEGMQSSGFEGTLRWLDTRAISVSAFQAVTQIWLHPHATLPRRTGRIRRLQIVRDKHAVQFAGILPRGMSASTLQALLLRNAKAAHARNTLHGGDS